MTMQVVGRLPCCGEEMAITLTFNPIAPRSRPQPGYSLASPKNGPVLFRQRPQERSLEDPRLRKRRPEPSQYQSRSRERNSERLRYRSPSRSPERPVQRSHDRSGERLDQQSPGLPQEQRSTLSLRVLERDNTRKKVSSDDPFHEAVGECVQLALDMFERTALPFRSLVKVGDSVVQQWNEARMISHLYRYDLKNMAYWAELFISQLRQNFLKTVLNKTNPQDASYFSADWFQPGMKGMEDYDPRKAGTMYINHFVGPLLRYFPV